MTLLALVMLCAYYFPIIMKLFYIFIEIPLFHVLNARITFGNIFGLDEAVPGVTPIQDEKVVACVLDDSCFDTPAGYVRLGETFVLAQQPKMHCFSLLIYYSVFGASFKSVTAVVVIIV